MHVDTRHYCACYDVGMYALNVSHNVCIHVTLCMNMCITVAVHALCSLVPATRIFPPTVSVGGNIRVAGTRLCSVYNCSGACSVHN